MCRLFLQRRIDELERGKLLNQFLGKYRGTVINNQDPQSMGRIAVQVPDVSNVETSTWALPCAHFAGTQAGFFSIPPVGANVWVEFEQGNSDFPIWSGCFWGSSAEVPPMAIAGPPGVQTIVLQSVQGNILMISDAAGPTGGILLKTSSGSSIAINDTGITITNGQATISISGPTMSVNNGALAVT
jgi:uncharacterized protein involved in type VI secretion and phage assembly